MRFEGKIWKEEREWLIEVPAFDAMTQGRTKADAFSMVKDLLETMADDAGFEVTIYPTSRNSFEVGANKVTVLTSLLLRRQREASGLSLADVAARLGQTSRTAYARYEQGRSVPTIEKLEQLLEAVAPDRHFVWRVAS